MRKGIIAVGLALLLIVLVWLPVDAWGAQFVGIRAYDLNAASYVDDRGVYHPVVAPPLKGARAYICVKSDCAWYTTDDTGVAGVWVDWGTWFSVTPAPPIGYKLCLRYSVVAWQGMVGASAIMQDEVWTGLCSWPDANPCPAWGCGPGLN